MNIVVQKYGGSSVKDKESLERVCDKIICEAKKGSSLVVIVSAQGKTTNELIAKAGEYINENENENLNNIDENYTLKRDLDFLLATGEMQTASLLSLMLNSKGYSSVCLNGAQAGIMTDSNFGNAKICNIVTDNIVLHLQNNNIVIITGFQGIDKMGNITTLGRGGSDLSAVAIACALECQKCEIYSDIDGIYSADPKLISTSKLIDKISYDEMLEASSAGAKVLHNRSVNMAKEHNLEIVSKCTFSDSQGSRVTNDISENFDVHFITKKDDVSKICIVGTMMLSQKDTISKIFKIADEQNIPIYMITFSELAINIVVDTSKSTLFMELLHDALIYIKND